MIIFTSIESLFLELLQAGIWDKQANSELFNELTAEEWENIIQLSVSQGVQAIVFDGAMRLPSNLHPPRYIKLKWIVNVDVIEQGFDRYLNTCSDLVKLYAEHRIKTMVLKGIGLAYLYPVPRHRECGDIDIWLFGEYMRGNKVMKKQGIDLDHGDDKHDLFYYQGIPIENHRKFTNEHRYEVDVLLESALNEILTMDLCDKMTLPKNVSVFTPPATFNAIFLARHMIVHFVNGICMRHLCDWTMFLEKNQGQYYTKHVIEEFRDAGMLELVTAYTKMCVTHLGLPKHCNPFKEIDTSELEEKMFADILRRQEYEINSTNPFVVLYHKWLRFYENRWRYKLVHRIGTAGVIWAYVKVHINDPLSVFKKT